MSRVTLALLLVACGGGESASVDAGDTGQEPSWVAIAGGEFLMGCGDGDCPAWELPTRTVTVAGFELMASEVTQQQLAAWAPEHQNRFPDCPSCPSDTISWDDAKGYCEAMGWRLPSESEWEYAARGGSGSIYGCGDDPACLAEVAWYFDNADNQTHPVMAKEGNDFGLHDMLGNVWEWVGDCWHDDFSGAPSNGSAWQESGCEYRVARGGNWGLSASGLRVSNRQGDYPGIYYVAAPGFRCARGGE